MPRRRGQHDGLSRGRAAGESRHEQVISFERKVRVAAGAIVLTGVLFAHCVNSAFIWLWLHRHGLIFAAITDWCGMLIARMPWNQRGSAKSCTK
jgi:Protein of unknown function (DUF2892)